MAAHEAGRSNRWNGWLRRFGSWSWRYWLRFPVYSLGPVAIVAVVLCAYGWSEASISTAGACLQGVGFAFVLMGVVKTRRQFNLPSLSDHMAEAQREFPRPRPDIVGTADITAALQSSSAFGIVGAIGTAPPRDVESRLDALETEYQKLRTTVADLKGDTEVEFRKHVSRLEAERDERVRDHDTLRSALRETATGGLDLAVYGIIVGICATVFSTFSHGIASYLGGETATPASTQIVVQPRLPRTPLVTDAGLVRT